MSAKTLYRASGLALLLGAILGTMSNVLQSVFFSGNDPQQFTSFAALALALLAFLGNALLVIGLPGIGARLAERAGWLGFVGFVLTLLGGVLVTSLTFTLFAIFPSLAEAAPKVAANFFPPSLFVSIIVSGALLGIGGVLLGVAILRAGIWPRWTGLALVLGAILNFVDSFLSGGILNTILSIVSFLLFAVALGWIGYELMTIKVVEGAAQPIASSSQATA